MNRDMPDVVTAEKPDALFELEWVGMEEVELPIQLKHPLQNGLNMLAARANVFVNLVDTKAKGIHMSRLFLAATETLADSELSPLLVEKVLDDFLSSHKEISNKAKLELNFDFLTRRSALKSQNVAWRSYPVHIQATKSAAGETKIFLGVEVQYSSTCPCSAALSRQLNQENFLARFGDRQSVNTEELSLWFRERTSVAATPHAQRSLAKVYVEYKKEKESFAIESLIDAIESAVKTPVQAAVKREDEQEFARLNANNLMFSEDAGRRIKAGLSAIPEILDFHGKISHLESLHPHDAVVFFKKD